RRPRWWISSTLELKPENSLCVETGNRCGGAGVEPGRDHVLDRVEVRHVERIIGAQHHMVGAEGFHQHFKLNGAEHHRVEVDVLLQVMRRWLWQRTVGVRSRAPGVVDAAEIGAEV